MSSFESLPDELIHQILHYLEPEHTLKTVALLSRRLNNIACEPLLWKHYCQTNFRYWSAEHRFDQKIHGKLHDVDWRALYLLRLKRNSRIADLVDGIVASRVLRLEKTENICQYGYDAKDYLLTQCRIHDDAEDVLARRFVCVFLCITHLLKVLTDSPPSQILLLYRSRQHTPKPSHRRMGQIPETCCSTFRPRTLKYG